MPGAVLHQPARDCGKCAMHEKILTRRSEPRRVWGIILK